LKNQANSGTIKSRHIPERSCVACRHKKEKRELIRLVCNSNKVEIDLQGKMPGRGAYLCSKPECWESGAGQNRLDHALRTKVSSENRQLLIEYARNLTGKET
jgi:uncharacterized protein